MSKMKDSAEKLMADMKEEAPKVVEKAAKAAKKSVKTVKSAARKAESATEDARKAVSDAASKVTKKAQKETVYLQFYGNEVNIEDIRKKVKEVWTKEMKKKVGEMHTVTIYMKPEENLAYYVINGEVTGSVALS